MGPKVDAVIEFVESTGNRCIICNLDDIQKAVEGVAGTEISQ